MVQRTCRNVSFLKHSHGGATRASFILQIIFMTVSNKCQGTTKNYEH